MSWAINILYFLDFPFFVGGSNKVLLTQAFLMRRRGFRVKVVIPNDADGCHAAEYDRICKEYGLDTLTARYSVAVCMEDIDIVAALEEYQPLVCLIEAQKPDLIHSAQLNIAVEMAARELKIPHLMNIYQVDKQSFRINWMNIYPQYHSADSLLFSRCWGEGLGIPSRCIRVAYENKGAVKNQLHTDHFPISLVSIGVLCERKQQLKVIRFVLRCKEEGCPVRLVILGNDENPYGELCRKFVAENGLSEIVTFAGFVSNVEHYLQSADLLIQASVEESYPGVIVESMANRVPVLSTPVAGVPELLKDGENGFLSDGYQEDNLYHAFLNYLEYRESGRLPSLVEHAYQTYLENHTYAVAGDQLEQYYTWILQDYSRNGNRAFRIKAENVMQKLGIFAGTKPVEEITEILKDKRWFFLHVCEVLSGKENTEILIWGAGYWGGRVSEWLQLSGRGHMIKGFIDTRKQGEYLGYPIFCKEDPLTTTCGTILIAVADPGSEREIIAELEKSGKVRNRDYFRICNHFMI